ncbi:alkylation response protein AidB-like acyl-CoA dehydrogenase [Acinetobacter calcoaceticus]|uniref:Alkylation response protein AidB-like acyl-CoA dehydrogenase n=1 Tax=Acinetobacter calcoaceticus TaxID=471 RepID=A0A4R1XDW1_ACICA|nr:alkylation response protein AidB-like acyl-CoA dehydrogenase [Acinetobacter calcoaceticus]
MINPHLAAWLIQHAEDLNTGVSAHSLALLKQLGQADIFRHGVPIALGGLGDRFEDAIESIAELAEYSLTAAFVAWSQRTYIEYLLSPQQDHDSKRLQALRLQQLLNGDYAGATGLSNAMKFLSGLETLNVQATTTEDGWQLNGHLPWVTNLHPQGFSVAVAADSDQGPLLFLVPSNRDGFERLADLDLIALRGSATAAAQLHQVQVSAHELLSAQATDYLAEIRPAFMALQCGLAIGLIKRSIKQVQQKKNAALIHDQIQYLQQQLAQSLKALYQGLATGVFKTQASGLFQIRIGLSELTQQAIQLELCSAGGKCYLRPYEEGFSRRLKEAAFIPIVTPSVLQLKTELSRRSAQLVH